MTTPSDFEMEIVYDRVALGLTRQSHRWATAFTLALGLLVLTGWTVGIEWLYTPLPAYGSMKIPTATGIVLAAVSLYLWQKPESKKRSLAAKLCGFAVTFIGLVMGAKCMLAWHSNGGTFHIFPSGLLSRLMSIEHQMAFNTAFSITLAGCALFLLDFRTRRGGSPAEWLALSAGIVPLAALIGYMYGVHRLINPFATPFSPGTMALHTAVALLALSIAILTARPERGWMARFLSSRPEGVVARKLLPAGITALLVLGWLTKSGESAGLYEHEEEVAILVAISTLIFGLLIRHSMNSLATLEASRQHTEASLQKSQEHLKMALDAACVGTWEWDILTNEVKWSDSIADIFGLPRGSFDGRYETYLKLIHPEDREVLKVRLSRALEGVEDAYRSEHRIVWPDGSVHWLAARGEVFRDGNGEPVRVAGTTMDITERRLLERELIEASNREQRRLGQDLHDDLGQWLTGIHLETRALTMKLKGKSEADAAHAERIVTCIREALERTRMLARGMTPAVIESGGLASALQELAASTERMFRTSCHCLCSEEVIVRNAEAALQLFRIAQEAISNAVRHGTATEIVVSLEPRESGRACLVIRDNGSGIPQPLPQSAGLGLHIMRYRAGLLGANVDIRPAAGGGTEVICCFSSGL